MDKALIKLLFGVLILAGTLIPLFVYWQVNRKKNTQRAAQQTAVEKLRPYKTLEERLEFLAGCGFSLKPEFTVDKLLEAWDREEYEAEGDWDPVLIGLGCDEEQEPYRALCQNLWYFDVECIEDDGDYVRIAERVDKMTGGALRLENIKDRVDYENKLAWLSFDVNGRNVKWDLKFQDDYVEDHIFNRFAALLAEVTSEKVLVYYDTGSQCCIIGCTTVENLKKLQDHGLAFVKVEPFKG